MSYVTNVLLSFSVMENSYEADGEDIYPLMILINTWLIEHGYGAFGRDVDHVSGGNKHLEIPFYVAAFNKFDLPAFLGLLRALPWIEPDNVQVFVQEDDEDRFYVIEPCASAAMVQIRAEQAFREGYQQMDGAHRQRNLVWIRDMQVDERGLL